MFSQVQAGELDHLAATFLLSHNIAHGNNLRKSPALQYLYYLSQVAHPLTSALVLLFQVEVLMGFMILLDRLACACLL